MARPQQLQPGQINPQAKPVDTFIQPAQKSAIKVAEPQQLPATPQLNTIAQGGSTFVQGQNSFAQLADDLKKFSPVVQEAAGELGMRYVGWRMDVGEQMAMQEVQMGLAKLDEEAEVAGDERAAATRRVEAVDPGAGWLMRTLDPYQKMGYERGKVKMAGKEIALGLPVFLEANKDKIDYTKDDLGMGDLQRLQAQYQSGVEQRFGISSASPGYQKYFAPRMVRAQEQAAAQLMDNRTLFYEGQIAPQAEFSVQKGLLNLNNTATSETFVDDDGNLIEYFITSEDGKTKFVNPWWTLAKAKKLGQEMTSLLARAPLGQANKIARQLYVNLARQYAPGTLQRRVLDAVPFGNGTLSTVFSAESRAADVGYTSDEATLDRNRRTLIDTQFKDEYRTLVSSGQYSPQGAVDLAIERINKRRARQGLPDLTEQEKARLRGIAIRERDELNPAGVPAQQTPSGSTGANDPDATDRMLNDLQTQSPYQIDVAAERNRLRTLQQGGIPPDQQAEVGEITTRLDTAERLQRQSKEWNESYAAGLDRRIEDLIGDQGQIGLSGQNKQEARDRIYLAVEERMRPKLEELAQNQNTPLSNGQVGRVLIDEWRIISQEVLSGEFPIPGYKNTPSTGNTVPQPIKQEPAKPAKPGGTTPAPMEMGVGLDQLDQFPRRNNRLRDWKGGKSPILSAGALITVIKDAAAGRPENKSFTKAWKQAGAPNAWAFIQSQMRFYPNLGKNGKGWTQEDENKAKQDLLSFLVRDANRIATARLESISPTMARLNNWASEIV